MEEKKENSINSKREFRKLGREPEFGESDRIRSFALLSAMSQKEMTQESKEGRVASDPNPNPNPCPICLGHLNQEAYLDRCFHRFCYHCIVRWTEVVSSRSSSRQASSVKCPLCKTENFSIVYGYDGSTFQQHFINQNDSNSTFFSMAHKYRLQCYYTKPSILSDIFKVGHYWKSRKYLQPNKWLEKWLRRELQALIQEEDIEIVMHHILGVIESFSRSHDPKDSTRTPKLKQEEFKVLVADAARPFLTVRTERFVDEVELFLASGLTVEAYDEAYKRCLGWTKAEDISEGAEITGSEQEAIANIYIAPYLYLFYEDSDESG